ncbi:glycerate kinase [Algoriphagus sp. CAU 1675]|uniref:glycerate kinase n=1 Tax=Algoriphagus sp. CAU 1675 TaxID=3032597 RepID=UPI0023DAEC55|nr:glycerate kinase [Algoriphagus sp. CAU 1675]MDF2157761.1 glycerate kinase [Algoriphagus sp. CAU 1675]
MRILISPNAFKGTISAGEAGEIIDQFFKENHPHFETKVIPLADGGDGTCALLSEFLGLEKIKVWSLDPFGKPTMGFYGWSPKNRKAYLDVSTASGLGLLGNQSKNPWVASTYGTGLLIKDAVQRGAEEIVLGLGGSATVDLGLGILSALGIHFLDQNGRELVPFTDSFLSSVSHIQLSPSVPKIKFSCLCDVRNQFFGDAGAIPVFGPQKGLKKEEFLPYESKCRKVVEMMFSKAKKEFIDLQGFGAAGGIALGLSAFFPTEMKFGAPYFFEMVHLSEELELADCIITGEGRYDSQSEEGKACFELLRLAKKKNKKVILITAGDEAFGVGFNQILKLPDLDFSKVDYPDQAKLNLKSVIRTNLDFDFFQNL